MLNFSCALSFSPWTFTEVWGLVCIPSERAQRGPIKSQVNAAVGRGFCLFISAIRLFNHLNDYPSMKKLFFFCKKNKKINQSAPLLFFIRRNIGKALPPLILYSEVMRIISRGILWIMNSFIIIILPLYDLLTD